MFSVSRDRSRCGIKSCGNPKNQTWEKSRNQWYLSHSPAAENQKSGIHIPPFWHTRNCGSTVRLGSRRIHAEKAAKHGLGKSLLDELVQRTLWMGPCSGPPPRRTVPARRPLCRLGWADPTKIPVDTIAEEWRSQSFQGRYESALWREAGREGRAPT